jgi:hypothetical protein
VGKVRLSTHTWLGNRSLRTGRYVTGKEIL